MTSSRIGKSWFRSLDVEATFRKVRAVIFTLIICLSLLYISLLCVGIFLQWDDTGSSQHGLVVALLMINVITVIMLPLLLVVEFRVWLDAARLLFLLTTHIGIAAMLAYWNPRLSCPEQTPDTDGICRLLDVYILLVSWVDPVFLVAYAICLCGLVYWRYRHPDLSQSPEKLQRDEENSIARDSGLPMMLPPGDIDHRHRSQLSMLESAIDMYSNHVRTSRPSWRASSSHAQSSSSYRPESHDAERQSPRVSARLSKPIPPHLV